MTQLAYQIRNSTVASRKLQLLISSPSVAAPSQQVLKLGLVLAALQIVDGILTGVGVHLFGTSIELNALLRLFMDSFGPVAALVITKTFALMAVATLCIFSRQVSWLPHALKAVIGVYVCLAVVPWTYLLLSTSGII